MPMIRWQYNCSLRRHDRALFIDYAGSCVARQHRCFFPVRGDLTGYSDGCDPDWPGSNVRPRVPLPSRERERPVEHAVLAHQDVSLAIAQRLVNPVRLARQLAVQKQSGVRAVIFADQAAGQERADSGTRLAVLQSRVALDLAAYAGAPRGRLATRLGRLRDHRPLMLAAAWPPSGWSL